MVLRVFKAAWFFSLLGTLAALLLVYAGLPEKVVVREEAAKLLSLPKETFFYLATAVIGVINLLVFPVGKVLGRNEPFRIWFYGFVATLNIFFIVALNLISTFNSGEKFNYQRIDFIIYGSVILILLWAVSWPIYSLYQKISSKQKV